jgi:hypothetical protein
MTKINDGGSAFPIVFQADARFNDGSGDPAELTSPGMTLRDYFAAHAPIVHWFHFEPVMPAPKPDPEWGDLPEHERWDASPVNWTVRLEWDQEYQRQCSRQWPWFYADAMLAERAKVEGR